MPAPASVEIMGVLNATPDSFSDGGRLNADTVVAQARALVAGGATWLDIGGESTRPGAAPLAEAEELRRVVPVLESVRAALPDVPLSIDTRKAGVARAAIRLGATMVNDVSALGDPAMAALVAEAGVDLVLMHMRGTPETMQAGPIVYADLLGEITAFLRERIARARAAGVAAAHIWIDPGLGFGKTTAHNLTLTRELGALRALGHRVVYGPSRKRFLGEVTGREVDDRERATAAACALAVAAGADMVRVHDAAAVRDAVMLASAVRAAP